MLHEIVGFESPAEDQPAVDENARRYQAGGVRPVLVCKPYLRTEIPVQQTFENFEIVADPAPHGSTAFGRSAGTAELVGENIADDLYAYSHANRTSLSRRADTSGNGTKIRREAVNYRHHNRTNPGSFIII